MEKRRRERINRSLEELKNLILDNATTNVRKNKACFSMKNFNYYFRMFVVIN